MTPTAGTANPVIHVVVFGIGDLRVDDHLGLQAALLQSKVNNNSNSNNTVIAPVLPLVLLDPKTLSATPQFTSTAPMIVAAVQDLAQSLTQQQEKYQSQFQSHFQLQQLHIATTACALDQLEETYSEVHYHVCDLGPVDNALGYGAYGAHFMHRNRTATATTAEDAANSTNSTTTSETTQTATNVHPWTCHLREGPWLPGRENIISFPQHERQCQAENECVILPTSIENIFLQEETATRTTIKTTITTTATLHEAMSTTIPTALELVHLVQDATTSQGDTTNDSSTCNNSSSSMVNLEEKVSSSSSTGLYATHWGGLPAQTVGEQYVLKTVQDYVYNHQQQDELWWKSSTKTIPWSKQTPTSLEHATLSSWMMMNDNFDDDYYPDDGNHNDDDKSATTTKSTTKNLIAGELMTRYLAAPLFLGTISPRRLWHIAAGTTPAAAAAPPPSPFVLYKPALQTLVEGREWHKLLASRQEALQQQQKRLRQSTNNSNNNEPNNDFLTYKYWRWHGFLCRYAKQDLTATTTTEDDKNNSNSTERTSKKQGLLLVHGFGASSSQWKRTIHALQQHQQQLQEANAVFDQVLAPDLIGFAQCEKPPITYTQYLWSGFIGDFAKEIGIAKEGWDSYVIGGNSIGGYTSMSAAADDSVRDDANHVVSSLGSPGSNRCNGLVLFNTAGNIRSREEMDELPLKATATPPAATGLLTVAQQTVMNKLPPCSPPPRPLARLLGNALLAYLRPNISQICKKVYPIHPDAADQELCSNILRDSLDPGAINVMISGAKLPVPRTVNEILAATSSSDVTTATPETRNPNRPPREATFRGPVLVAQGMLDPLNDAKTRATLLGTLRDGITVAPIEGGHCPHDEVPQACVDALLKWMKTTTPAKQIHPQQK